jgi:large subunit ribosomal protein L13
MEKQIIIDATNATLGRLSSYAAKQSLQGKRVIIINSEKAIVTGRKKFTTKSYQEKKRRKGSSQRGPFFPRDSARVVKRTIKGMLPNYREGRGKEAYRRIFCYKGVPEEYKDEKAIKAGKEKNTSYISIGELSKRM